MHMAFWKKTEILIYAKEMRIIPISDMFTS